MGITLAYQEGQTPLDEEEKEGLLIPTITTREELDEFEQLNIEKALEWTLRRRFTADTLFSEDTIRSLHKRMLGDVWRWAGEFRTSEKNIGISRFQIPIELRKLIDDTRYWVQAGIMEPDEIAIRFKHRIVSIHCFANGNGRHSRLMADIIASKFFQLPVFRWGNSALVKADETRKQYLQALHSADKNDYKKLITFARSGDGKA